MNAVPFEVPTLDDHEKAILETAFLLDIFASTISDLMGGATASISRIAGRSMARKLPVYLSSPDLQKTMRAVSDRFEGGFDIRCLCREQAAELTIGKCAIRKVCAARGLELNGPLCQLFHYYLDGVVNELYYRPVKSQIVSAGDACTVHLDSK